MKKRKLPKTTKVRSHHKIKRVKLPKDTVLRVEAHSDAVPVVVASAQGAVDVVSVHKEEVKQQGWWERWFGE